MNRHPDDGYAFPVSTIDGFTQHGLTKREDFAKAAMQGLIANKGLPTANSVVGDTAAWAAEYATRCAVMADALLAELSKSDPMTREQQAEQAGSRG